MLDAEPYKISETFQNNHSLSAMCYVIPPTHKGAPVSRPHPLENGLGCFTLKGE